MALTFVLDEHFRGPLWQAIVRHNLGGEYRLDVVRVGDPADLPLATDDSAILLWAEREGRILVTEDRHTIALICATILRRAIIHREFSYPAQANRREHWLIVLG
jgi:hypothetical protein